MLNADTQRTQRVSHEQPSCQATQRKKRLRLKDTQRDCDVTLCSKYHILNVFLETQYFRQTFLLLNIKIKARKKSLKYYCILHMHCEPFSVC